MKGIYKYNFLIIIFLTFCIQFTDLKIGLIKVSELILLLLLPIFIIKKTNKFIFYLLVFFSIVLIISLIKTIFIDFQYLGNSLLKSPYIISISRYLEIVTCLILCNISLSYFKSKEESGDFSYYLNYFINLNIIITIVFVLIYIAVILDVIPIDETRVVYSNNRLRGYFVEGGPYGLMLSFIFILTNLLPKGNYRLYKRLFLIVVILFLAKSKAGFLCAIVWLGIENHEFLKRKVNSLIYPILVLGIVGFYFLFINISSMYVNEIGKIKTSLSQRPGDSNVMMGRIPGVFIVPKMINQNPVFGIGTGNYPLLRNNEEYRGFFPLPVKEIRILDSHGFGGIIDIIVDNGFVGFLFFSIILFIIYRDLKYQKKEKFLLAGFLLLFLFGVQIYFLYPWILLGIILVKKNIYEVSS